MSSVNCRGFRRLEWSRRLFLHLQSRLHRASCSASWRHCSQYSAQQHSPASASLRLSRASQADGIDSPVRKSFLLARMRLCLDYSVLRSLQSSLLCFCGSSQSVSAKAPFWSSSHWLSLLSLLRLESCPTDALPASGPVLPQLAWWSSARSGRSRFMFQLLRRLRHRSARCGAACQLVGRSAV